MTSEALFALTLPLFWIALELRSLRKAIERQKPIDFTIGYGTALTVNGKATRLRDLEDSTHD